MIRYFSAALTLTFLAVFATGAAQNGDKWGTIVKGRIVWGGDTIPEQPVLKVTNDQKHCEEKGPLHDTNLVINPKNKGMKWVFVALAQDPENADKPLPVNPKLKDAKKKPVVLDQPRCLFTPRAIAVEEGQDVIAKNSSSVVHNIRWAGDPTLNPGGNVSIPAGQSFEIKNLQAQRLPLILQCSIHPWMQGRLAVYSHPYFAVTDENGNFAIKLPPAGKYRLVVYQESIGWRDGAKGKNGAEIDIKAGAATDLGELKMGGKK